MIEFDSSRPKPRVVVQTTTQACALLEHLNQDLLAELLERPASANTLAKTLGIAMNTLHYRLRKLESLELIRVSQVQPRAGRGIKLYEPVALIWDIPFELTPAATARELARLDIEGWLERSLDSIVGKVKDRFSLSFGKLNAQRAYLEYNLSPGDDQSLSQAFVFAQTLRLTEHRALELRAQLRALIEPFLHEQDGPGENYSLSVLFHATNP